MIIGFVFFVLLIAIAAGPLQDLAKCFLIGLLVVFIASLFN